MSNLSRKQLLLITTVALGTLLNPLNSSMIAVALSRVREDFHLSFVDASWLISTFYLTSAIAQPVMGKLSDIFGRKRLFMTGLILIAAASVAAPFSPGFGWLIAFRMIQAVGSSTLFPAGMGIIRNKITENQARALAVLSVFSSTSAAFGPSIGGFLVHFGDWPAIFLVNFPIIVVSFLLAIRVLPQDPPVQKRSVRLDYGGIVLFSLMIIGWMLFLLDLEQTVSWWKLGVSLLTTFLFYWYESGRVDPFVDVQSLKKNMNASLVYVQFILVNIVFYSVFFGVPTYLQNVQQFNESTTGLIMLSIAGFGVIITPLAGRWMDRSGPKPALLIGAASIIAGTLLMNTIQDASPVWWIFLVLAVLGISNGINNIGLQTALYSFVPRNETGAASGLFMTSRYIGTILSSSLLGILFGSRITTGNFHLIALVCTALGVVIYLLTARMPKQKIERE
jgi:MFS family permease